MVDCLQVNSSRWAPSIDRSVKLNTWLCFLADSREIEEQVEPSHPPSPAIDYRQNPVHSRKEFTCNLLEFPLELATGISTPYNCIAHPNGFHGVYSVEPNARCCHNYPSSEKIIVLCMKNVRRYYVYWFWITRLHERDLEVFVWVKMMAWP